MVYLYEQTTLSEEAIQRLVEQSEQAYQKAAGKRALDTKNRG